MKHIFVIIACVALTNLGRAESTPPVPPAAQAGPAGVSAPAYPAPSPVQPSAAAGPAGVPAPAVESAPAPAAAGPVQPVARPPVPASPMPEAPAAGQVLLEIEIYRIRGDIAGQTSLTDNVWEQIKGEDLAAVKGAFTFFTLADLTIAGVRLRANERQWTWNRKPEPPPSSRVETLARPRVVVLAGESFEMTIGTELPIEYFERRDDGLFELKQLHEQTGLTLKGTVEKSDSDRVMVRNLNIALRSIEKREPIEGVSLDVGRPIIMARQFETSLSIKPQCYYGIQLATEGYGFLVLRLRAKGRSARPSAPQPPTVPSPGGATGPWRPAPAGRSVLP